MIFNQYGSTWRSLEGISMKKQPLRYLKINKE